MTTTVFNAYHLEDNSESALRSLSGQDQANGTAYQNLSDTIGSGSDECGVGILYLFAPSSTTYVKQFYSTVSVANPSNAPASQVNYTAGYVNVTGAINQVSFKMSSGNFDGIIKMYGCR